MTDKATPIQKPIFKKRPQNSHKGTFGTAFLVCGSYGMAGAALLSGKACLKSGVGILKMALREKIYPIFTTALPEAVCLPFNRFSYKSALKKGLLGADTVLFGCGASKNRTAKNTLSFLIKNVRVPLIIDADGINLLSKRINILKQVKAPIILTPHPAEMSRLTGIGVAQIEANRQEIAQAFAKEHKVFLILKGHNTLVVSPDGAVDMINVGMEYKSGPIEQVADVVERAPEIIAKIKAFFAKDAEPDTDEE